MYTLSKTVNDEIKLLTSIDEITPEYVEDCLKNVIISPYYAIIGIVSKMSLFEVLNMGKKNSEQTVTVIPILGKKAYSFKDGEKFVTDNVNIANKIIISPSEVMRGHHVVSTDNKFSPSYVIKAITENKQLLNDCVKGNVWNSQIVTMDINAPKYNSSTKFCFLEFKVVPVNSIIGAYIG